MRRRGWSTSPLADMASISSLAVIGSFASASTFAAASMALSFFGLASPVAAADFRFFGVVGSAATGAGSGSAASTVAGSSATSIVGSSVTSMVGSSYTAIAAGFFALADLVRDFVTAALVLVFLAMVWLLVKVAGFDIEQSP